MCTIIQKYANTGLVNISTANSNLDGTGPRGTVLTSGGTVSGTKVNAVTVKATGNTLEGMVRLFVNNVLFQEVPIPANTQTDVVPAFQATIMMDLSMNPSDTLYASTQQANSFNIYANGVDWVNCECSDDCNCSDVTTNANTGLVNIATGNPLLNGLGAIGTALTAPTGSLVYGTKIFNIDIKATMSTTQGMIRVFLNDTVTNFLIWEVPVPTVTQTNVKPAYRTGIIAIIDLQAGYSLGASTQNSESYNIIAISTDVSNCACS